MSVVLIWAANYPLTKFGLIALDPFVFNSIRFIVAFLLLVVLLLMQSRSLKIDRADRLPLFRLGFILSVVYQCAFIIGINNTSAGNASVILSTSPLWTAFFSARMNKTRLLPQTWIGLVVSLMGIILIIIGSGKRFEISPTEIYGDILCLSAAILWGLSTTLQKPLLAHYSTVELSVMILGVGAVGLTLIAIPPALKTDWTTIPFSSVLAAVLSGLLSIGIANVLWSYGVKNIGPSRTANFNNLVPIFAFLIAYGSLGEKVTELQVLGAAITIIGVWIVRRR